MRTRRRRVKPWLLLRVLEAIIPIEAATKNALIIRVVRTVAVFDFLNPRGLEVTLPRIVKVCVRLDTSVEALDQPRAFKWKQVLGSFQTRPVLHPLLAYRFCGENCYTCNHRCVPRDSNSTAECEHACFLRGL